MPTPSPAPEPAPGGPPPSLAALRARLAPRWLNAPPLLVALAPPGAPPELVFIEPALADRAVLLAFWDYTCLLSLKTIPFLAAWHRRYTRFGLTVVGIHAPEFSFGLDRASVELAVARLGIRFPVVLDNDFALWRALDNHGLPRTLLLDRTGAVVLDHEGRAGYAQIATHLIAALAAGGPELGLPVRPHVTPSPPAAAAHLLPATPDLYGGFWRGDVGNTRKLDASGGVVDFPDEKRRAADRIYLSGRWRATRESLIALPGPRRPAVLRVRATAAEVGAVLRGSGAGSEARLLLDGRPVAAGRAGADLGRGDGGGDDPGAGVVRAREPRLHHLVRGTVHATMELALVIESGELECFALRFLGGHRKPGPAPDAPPAA